ncbi:MAG: hypothetical protein CMH61_01970 [Nanoarchaeota archaeon]|nr:hypothetical protein [Nanoarchaeota archaeon]|tara:strand:- start:1921 stop:2520 length:600 start_codon:yes stop_codon:yes gene_type:complete
MEEVQFLSHSIGAEMQTFFQKQAEQKIQMEGWAKQNRNVDVKVANFVQCWTTEEAFKQILISKGIQFKNRGLYFGDAAGAGADFVVRIDGEDVSVGLRSISSSSLNDWKSVAYPDDRFRDEAKLDEGEESHIADYHVVCHNDNGNVRFFGIISKHNLMTQLEISPRLHSRKNQEYFRVIPLEHFKYDTLVSLLAKMDRV